MRLGCIGNNITRAGNIWAQSCLRHLIVIREQTGITILLVVFLVEQAKYLQTYYFLKYHNF